MKARIKLEKFPEGRPGFYALMEDEAQYERVKNFTFEYEKSKRVTHYLVPASVFERLLALDRASEKMCGHWETRYHDGYVTSAKCSCCGASALLDGVEDVVLSKFCPECGADLREPEEYDPEDPNKPEEQTNGN